MPWWLGPAFFGVGASVALGFAIAGVLRLGGPAVALQERLETKRERPIDAVIARTLVQFDAARVRVEGLPALLVRAQRALETLDESRRRLIHAATTVNGVIGLARYLFR